ncbi:hypothetical protein JOQ06_024236 [Pogonophryne albipinna]|uniref:Uncharacterized protein n=1 Tax=Pogonophryne albipinna TaxID=1090488 RepID=A0AAD6BMS0_9TELE|nr:hypothetical protein JOQ06_024236 [Pogonophryne albipinna]
MQDATFEVTGQGDPVVPEVMYSLLDVAVNRQSLYVHGLQIMWRCFTLLGRQVRLRKAAEQKTELLKKEIVSLKRKADGAKERLEVHLATASFTMDEHIDKDSQTDIFVDHEETHDMDNSS